MTESRHSKIVELFVKGLSVEDIAGHLFMAVESVSMIIESPTFKYECSIREKKRGE